MTAIKLRYNRPVDCHHNAAGAIIGSLLPPLTCLMSSLFSRCRYLTSAHKVSQLPPDEGMEIAIAGRSNAGKSTTLNSLTGDKRMAKTSKTPGRTQLLNVFDLGDGKRIVDLPGYGYAKVPPKIKEHWQREINRYLTERESLIGLVVVMDIRHPLREFDRNLLAWAHENGLKSHVLLNKADKLKSGKIKQTLMAVKNDLQAIAPSASVQTFSALRSTGKQAVATTLQSWFDEAASQQPLDTEPESST